MKFNMKETKVEFMMRLNSDSSLRTVNGAWLLRYFLLGVMLLAISACGGSSINSGVDDPLVDGPALIDIDQGSNDEPGNNQVENDGSIAVPLVDDSDIDKLPEVSAGKEQTADLNVLISLRGTAAAKNGATIERSFWKQIKKSGDPEVIIADPSKLNTAIISPYVAEPTVLTFNLAVIDSEGWANSATTYVEVNSSDAFVRVKGGVVAEAQQQIEVIVSLNAPQLTETIVNYRTRDITAQAGSDFVAASGSVTFDASETEKRIVIAIADTDINEEDERFAVDVSVGSSDNTIFSSGLVLIVNNSDLNPVGPTGPNSSSVGLNDVGPLKVELGETITNAVDPATVSSTAIITYRSSDPAIATVNNQGQVQGLAVGNVVITATRVADMNTAESTASYNLEVIPAIGTPVLGFTLPGLQAVSMNSSLDNPIDPNTVDSAALITYVSSDITTATVNDQGQVQANAPGSSVITATIDTGVVVTISYELVVTGTPENLVFSVVSASTVSFNLTVYSGEAAIDWGDGTPIEVVANQSVNTAAGSVRHSYLPATTGNITITFSDGLSSVRVLSNFAGSYLFDIALFSSLVNIENIDFVYSGTVSNPIQVDGQLSSLSGLSRLRNLSIDRPSGNVSGALEDLPRGLIDFMFSVDGGELTGDILDLPPEMISISALNGNSLTGDISTLPSSLKLFSASGQNTISGDIQNLPDNIDSLSIYGRNTIGGNLDLLSRTRTLSLAVDGSNTIEGTIAEIPTGITRLNLFGRNVLRGNIQDLHPDVTLINIRGANEIAGNLDELLPNLNLSLIVEGNNEITGSVEAIDEKITYLKLEGRNTFFGDIQSLHTQIRYFSVNGLNTINGDLGQLENESIQYLIVGGLNTIDQFSVPSVWNPIALQNLRIFRVDGNRDVGFNTSGMDNLLIHLNEILLLRPGGRRSIQVNRRGDALRSTASDSAFTSLLETGIIVSINELLTLPFSNADFLAISFTNQSATIDWGDGSPLEDVRGSASHSYSSTTSGELNIIFSSGLHYVTSFSGSGPFVFDFEFLNNFSRLRSATFRPSSGSDRPSIGGSLADLPLTLSSLSLDTDSAFFGRLQDIPPSLSSLRFTGFNSSFTGDLSELVDKTRLTSIFIESSNNTITGNIDANFPVGISSMSIMGGNNTIGGLVGEIPSTLTSLSLGGNNTLSGSIENLHSSVRVFDIQGNNTIGGDLGGVSSNALYNLSLGGFNSVSEFISPSVWRPTVLGILNFSGGNGTGFDVNEVDNILIFVDEINLSNRPGQANISIVRDNDAPRSSVSDSAVTGLETIGFAVNTNP